MGALKAILIDISDEFYRLAKREPTPSELNAVWGLLAGKKLTVRQCVRIVLEDGEVKS